MCYLALVLQRLSENKVALSTHEIINGLEGFLLNEINYDVDKLYMISDQHFDSKINKKIFKFKKKVLLNKEVENL